MTTFLCAQPMPLSPPQHYMLIKEVPIEQRLDRPLLIILYNLNNVLASWIRTPKNPDQKLTSAVIMIVIFLSFLIVYFAYIVLFFDFNSPVFRFSFVFFIISLFILFIYNLNNVLASWIWTPKNPDWKLTSTVIISVFYFMLL